MVGIQVEKRFKIKNEDIELAIEVNEERLANHDRFRKVFIQLSHRLSFFVNGEWSHSSDVALLQL